MHSSKGSAFAGYEYVLTPPFRPPAPVLGGQPPQPQPPQRQHSFSRRPSLAHSQTPTSPLTPLQPPEPRITFNQNRRATELWAEIVGLQGRTSPATTLLLRNPDNYKSVGVLRVSGYRDLITQSGWTEDSTIPTTQRDDAADGFWMDMAWNLGREIGHDFQQFDVFSGNNVGKEAFASHVEKKLLACFLLRYTNWAPKYRQTGPGSRGHYSKEDIGERRDKEMSGREGFIISQSMVVDIYRSEEQRERPILIHPPASSLVPSPANRSNLNSTSSSNNNNFSSSSSTVSNDGRRSRNGGLSVDIYVCSVSQEICDDCLEFIRLFQEYFGIEVRLWMTNETGRKPYQLIYQESRSSVPRIHSR